MVTIPTLYTTVKLTQNQVQNLQVKIEINIGPICLVTEAEDCWRDKEDDGALEGGQARASLMTWCGSLSISGLWLGFLGEESDYWKNKNN